MSFKKTVNEHKINEKYYLFTSRHYTKHIHWELHIGKDLPANGPTPLHCEHAGTGACPSSFHERFSKNRLIMSYAALG